eukprot:SAG22_NODE_9481_length_587_cov_1.485656_1_plen_26_part_10
MFTTGAEKISSQPMLHAVDFGQMICS